MSRVNRWLNARVPIAAIGLAAVVAGIPAPSLADHEDRNRRSEHRLHDRVRSEHRLHHGHASCDHRSHYDARLHRRHARFEAREERRRARHYARFHRTLARHHRGPAWIFASWW